MIATGVRPSGRDGQLSGVELIRARELQFTRVDPDGDGALTIEELDALRDELLQ